MNAFRLLFYQLKQSLLHPFFWLLLPLILILPLFFGDENEAETDAGHIAVGYAICTPDLEDISDGLFSDTDEKGFEEMRRSLSVRDSAFSFREYDSVTGLQAHVAAGELECGYMLPSDLFTCLLEGDRREKIRVLSSPESSLIPVVNEVFYSGIFEQLSPLLLQNYISAQADGPAAALDRCGEKALYDQYRFYLGNGSTLAFEYENAQPSSGFRQRKLLLAPLRGLFAVLILLAGFSGALRYYRASEQPVFARFSVRLVMILAPMLLSCIPVLLCYLFYPDLSAAHGNALMIFPEILRLFLYLLLCLIFLMLMTQLLRNAVLMYAFLPLYVLCCLVFSPIFIDAGSFIPLLKNLSWFFLPSWYLL